MFCTVRKSSINGVSSWKLGSQKKKEKALIFTLADFHGVSASTIADFKVSSDVHQTSWNSETEWGVQWERQQE